MSDHDDRHEEAPVDILAQLDRQFEQERDRLKTQLDELWKVDPAAARPVLADMQRLVNLLDEFSTIRSEVLDLLDIMHRIERCRSKSSAALAQLASLMDDWQQTRPRSISDRMRAYLEEHDPSRQVATALCFSADDELSILLEAAARLRHRVPTSCPHVGDDAAEAHLRRHEDPNEIPLADLFDD